MKTAVRRILLMSALMSPGALYALGLGEIHLNSALNQPFDADIELVSATQEDLSALRAALASNEAFSRYGIDRPAFLSDFTFHVTTGANGVDLLKVTSPKPVTEPFVTMLVEANWPRGHLMREYTVLLDPPVYAPRPAAAEPAVVTPRAASTAAPPTPAARAEAPAATAPAGRATAPAPRATASPSLEAGSTYRVRPRDTLWKIASAVNPGPRSQVNRAMVAIYQQNAQAFEGNINLLRAGSTLKIPQSSEIASISAASASAEVTRQYQMWRAGRPAAGQGPEAAGRLRLVTPEQGTAAPSTATKAPAAAPAPAVAAPGGAAMPPADMNNRVKQLEAELAEARRLLEVRNAELATLQGQAAPGAPGAGARAAAAAAAAAAPGAAPTQPQAAPTPAQPEAAAAPPPAEAAKPAAKPAAEPAKPPAHEGPTFLERVTNYWWVLLAAIAALLGMAVVQRVRRDRGTAEEDLEEVLGRDLRASRPAPPPRPADIVVEEKRATEVPPAAPRVSEPSRKPVSIEDTLSGEGPASIEAGDPLAEADFHMAYGLYDQAADLVQLAIKREPQRRDLKVKLLEIFFVWGNRDRFLELARELGAGAGGTQSADWDKVLIMGKQIAPEDPLFGAAPRAAAGSLDMELHPSAGKLDMELGTATATLVAPDLDLSAGEVKPAADAGLDFLIEEPGQGAKDSGATAPTVETAALAPTVEMASLARTIETTALAPTVKTTQLGNAGDTVEVAFENLGLEGDTLQGLDDLDQSEELFAPPPKVTVEDTVEKPVIKAAPGSYGDDDLLSSTGLMKMSEEFTGEETGKTAIIDLSEETGELPALASEKLAAVSGATGEEEAATMSEVGTKLDLARAYVDMGDPEGARSILAEVLQEGNAAQKQEAQRLMASLP